MFSKLKRHIPILIYLGILILFLIGCQTGIEDSPDSGILRVTLESDPSDTTIIIVTDTLTVSDQDVFLVNIFQGKAYQDSTFGVLYDTLTSNRQKEIFYNLIFRKENIYQRFTIYESYLPPFDYNMIEFGLDAEFIKLKNFDVITVETPPNFFLQLPVDFEIRENTITEINVQVSPFKYIERVKDTYIFAPEMEIIGVNYF
jgi:hypothetical protein